ncbi:MAG: nicotinate-nicotinamide nucleotide adenylyltransferase [Actinobacteria bacterium]|nr:nicotinate-nicotinamide nucleotide adenylyltransferase [Actinomycetota bacterium]
MAVGLFGGAFDPPHTGHVALAVGAKDHFGLPRLTVLVDESPGHKDVELPAAARLELARAAFPDDDVRVDPYARTIDLLRGERFDDPIFLIGADQFIDFLTWKEPEGVLELARLGVATRPGFDQGLLDSVLRGLSQRDRVDFFHIPPNPAASRDIRARVELGEPLDGLVPDAVERLIVEHGLYRGG